MYYFDDKIIADNSPSTVGGDMCFKVSLPYATNRQDEEERGEGT